MIPILGVSMNNLKKGNASAEMIMVLALMILFGVSMAKMVEAGSITQKNIIANKEAQVDARIALSFINVRLRQSDGKDKIEVKTHSNNKNALVIKERTEDYEYDTWIYFYDGVLYETITDPNEEPILLGGNPIARVENYLVTFDKDTNTIRNLISYKYGENNTNEYLDSTINIRSR